MAKNAQSEIQPDGPVQLLFSYYCSLFVFLSTVSELGPLSTYILKIYVQLYLLKQTRVYVYLCILRIRLQRNHVLFRVAENTYAYPERRARRSRHQTGKTS